MFNMMQNYEFFNGFGGFREDGSEYSILLDGESLPPAPWINVIANKEFGFMVSETGAGSTWAYNSRENKITPWSNDPISDSSSETIYIRDEISGKIMTPVSLGKKDRGTYLATHGFGYSRFEHDEEEIRQELTVFSPVDEPVKLWRLTLTNLSDRERYLALTYYVQWVMGVDSIRTGPYIVTSYNYEHDYMYAKNIYNFDFRKHRAFIFTTGMVTGYTGDRQEVLGLKGSVREPLGLDKKLSCSTGACYDSCGALQISISVKPGSSRTVVFGLGYSNDEEHVVSLRHKYNAIENVDNELERVKAYWEELLGVVKVETRDKAIDILVNGWLLYQTISCRLYARAAFYQCGGAYGFRDQLQDTMALVMTRPEALKEQILKSSKRQFEEGDVQHWWHPPTGAGVRTRITDDLLWMPYAVALYINSTGDWSILAEKTPYIKGPALEEGTNEMMFVPEVSDMEADLYEHCKKAICRIRYGVHGLPLMGGGDWNDGMNKAGVLGKGESVWLGWFIYDILGDFLPICRYVKDTDFASDLEQQMKALIMSIEKYAWDGEWYIRAFYDDGAKMGSKDNEECRIDSISQSWSIISEGADAERAQKAFQSAWKHLVIEREGVSLLLTPPFNNTEKDPGYIKNYYPGMRENGGQYTHAAVWLAIAAVMIGDSNKAYELFTMLNPIRSTYTRKDALGYEKEPYVMTADISYNDYYSGRGGWSWYTGSAGWMYQGLVKWFLGLEKRGEYLYVSPSVPESFGDYKITYKHGSTVYVIEVIQKPKGTGEAAMATVVEAAEVEEATATAEAEAETATAAATAAEAEAAKAAATAAATAEAEAATEAEADAKVAAAVTAEAGATGEYKIRLVDDGKRHKISITPLTCFFY